MLKKAVVLALVGSFALASCTTQNPYTGESQVSDTTIGAGAGALVGALGGLLVASGRSGPAKRNAALIGAGIGALTGGAIGNYMDRQQNELAEKLRSTGVSVTRAGDSIILNMPGNVTFATNESAINANFYNVLNSVAIVLNKYDQTIIDVYGYTDNTGSLEYNKQLSVKRATSVAQYLVSQGVISQRLIVEGFGPANPIASNDTPEGRAQNRRVEIKIVPYTGS